jgi:hypothetical protein
VIDRTNYYGKYVKEPQHGTRSRYRKGCRDECCRSVENAYQRKWRAMRRARAAADAVGEG